MLDGQTVERVLKRSLAAGGEFADLYFEEGNSTVIVGEDGKIEKILAGADRGVGLRVITDARTTYAYTNEVTEKALLELAAIVSRAARGEPHDVTIRLQRKDLVPASPVKLDPGSVPLRTKVAVVEGAERVARGFDRRVRQVMVVYRDSTARIQVANSLGEFRETVRTGTVFMVQVVSVDGEVIQTGTEPIGGGRGFELFDEYPPEEVAAKAARRAVLMLGAQPAPGGLMPVVLAAEAGGTMVHEAIGHGLEADLAGAGMSVYAGKIGEQVASPLVTIVDDASIPHARGSYPFDDEGTQAQRTVLVEHGVLKGYLYDRLSAMKYGATSTGNGRRESYQTKPIVRMSNTLIVPGEDDPTEIVRSVNQGLLVKKMGGGQVNTVTGDFMFEVAEGFLIQNGVVGEPVRGATLTGNGPEILRKVEKVGTDIGFGIGTCGKDGQGVPVADAQPTLLIAEMTVGGAVRK